MIDWDELMKGKTALPKLSHIANNQPNLVTVEIRIVEPCAMKSKIPFSGMEAKKTQQKHSKNTASFPLPRQKKKRKNLLTLPGKESPTT